MRIPESQSTANAEAAGRHTTAPFADILCAVDGSQVSAEVARQAIALAKPDAALCFMAVSHTVGTGLAAQAVLSEPRAHKALEECARLAQEAGISVSIELQKGARPSDLLLAEAERHDLLVVGSHGGSRAAGIMLGSTASQAAHRTEQALLVARQDGAAEDFPQRILLASDGSPGSWAAAQATLRIARARGSGVEIVYVPDGTDPERRRSVSDQIVSIQEATGVEPVIADAAGHVPERIIETARSAESSLIVVGRRGVHGIKALSSVGERIVHRAPCSVLVVPPREDPS